METPKAPTGLKTRGKRTWGNVAGTYELRPDELDILEDICREIDMIDDLERGMKDQPLTVIGSQGQPVAHPIISELRQHRATKKSLWAALKLPDDQAGADVNAQRKGGQSRWATAYGKSA